MLVLGLRNAKILQPPAQLGLARAQRKVPCCKLLAASQPTPGHQDLPRLGDRLGAQPLQLWRNVPECRRLLRRLAVLRKVQLPLQRLQVLLCAYAFGLGPPARRCKRPARQHTLLRAARLERGVRLRLQDAVNERRRQRQAVQERAQLQLGGLAVPQPHAHALALLLEGAYLRADIAQVVLKLAQHLLHSAQDAITAANLQAATQHP